MKTIVLAILLFLMSSSFCLANNPYVKKAYSLYYQGEVNAAIELMKDYIKENPDPAALYFLGYAYYEAKKMDVAMEYFNETYLIDPEFSPMDEKKVQ